MCGGGGGGGGVCVCVCVLHFKHCPYQYIKTSKMEHSDSVVECLTRDRGAAGSSLTGVTALWSLSKTHLS